MCFRDFTSASFPYHLLCFIVTCFVLHLSLHPYLLVLTFHVHTVRILFTNIFSHYFISQSVLTSSPGVKIKENVPRIDFVTMSQL